MSSLLITNGHLVTLDDEDRFIDNGSIFIEGHHIVEVGSFPADKYKAERTIDARGNLVMPGLINAHHHLYSTFARGFTPPGSPPRNFEEILAKLWWKLDMALDAEDVYYSALLALMHAARAGCTTVIKPAPQDPLAVILLGELLNDIFPPGVVNVVVGSSPSIGEALVDTTDVDMISFTGSSAVGATPPWSRRTDRRGPRSSCRARSATSRSPTAWACWRARPLGSSS